MVVTSIERWLDKKRREILRVRLGETVLKKKKKRERGGGELFVCKIEEEEEEEKGEGRVVCMRERERERERERGTKNDKNEYFILLKLYRKATVLSIPRE